MKDYKIMPKASLRDKIKKFDSLNRNLRLLRSQSVTRNDNAERVIAKESSTEAITQLIFRDYFWQKKTIAIIIFLFSLSFSHAQEKSQSYLDSLYNQFLSQQNIVDEGDEPIQSTTDEIIKCEFGIRAEIKTNLHLFPAKQRAQLEKLLQRKSLHTSLISPSGFFRIHYDTSGGNAPNYMPGLTTKENAQYAAEAFDSSYAFEVDHLGYLPPPSDNGNGGDNLYDVYISNLDSRNYGYTEFDFEIAQGSGKYASYINIDSDYSPSESYYTHGLDAMRVTAAHEFHHSIQLGSYIYRESDRYFHEISSTAMEEFVFDDVNDFYNYMYSYFDNTSRPFSAFGSAKGYDLAIWNIFIADRLGYNVLKRQWELMPQMKALDAIAASIIESGSSFAEMFNEFGIWTYFTNYRAKPDLYFEEAAEFPAARALSSLEFISGSKSVLGSSPAASNTLITFFNKQNSFPDTLNVIISNSDIKTSIIKQDSVLSFEYSLFDHEVSESKKLTADYFYKFNAQSPSFWSTAEVLNNELIKGAIFTEGKVDYAFPSPFYYGRNAFIFFPAKFDLFRGIDLNIYSSSMDMVYSSPVTVQKIYGQTVVRWDGKDNDGNKLASGVYIFAIRSGDDTSTGKLVIFNE